jgi:hypothetical protein
MNHKENIHELIKKISMEVLAFIKEEELKNKDKARWVPAAHIKDSLDLNLVAVHQANANQGARGWLFGIIARKLEDEKLIEYKKNEGRAFCRSI